MKRQLLSLVLVTILLLALLGARPAPVLAASFVVNSAADDANAHDWLPGDGLCVDSQWRCTLRAAIEEANAHTGDDIITFQSAMNIYINAGEGVLPSLDETVTIDASSVWDTVNDAPGVMINGQGGSFSGLYLGANSCQIYGLYITYFNGSGICVVSAANWIGGTGPGQRNVLSGNNTGISFHTTSAYNNVVRNNYIGLTPAGNTKNPNITGVLITGGTNNNTIGGSTPGEGNYISGNTWHGVYIQGDSANNNLYGNIIGLPATGSQNVGNGGYGVFIEKRTGDTTGPQYNWVGAASWPANTISANGQHGVYILGARNNYVEACTIAANTGDGVRIDGLTATGNRIQANSIHDNGGKGIELVNGSQHDIAAPAITSASPSGASGAGCGSCRIDIYSDNSDEGAIWHGYVTATVGGDWVYNGTIVGPYVTATATDNFYVETSEFSAPKRAAYFVYLPLILR